MSKYAWPWDQDTGTWSLEADPRYQVRNFTIEKINAGEPGYAMVVDGYVVDYADAAKVAMMRLESVYEYEEHGAELELARLRLRQARERLEERYPRVARDAQLASILEGLGDALGAGPEANDDEPGCREPDVHRAPLAPDLGIAVDSSLCIVFEVTDGPAGRVLRRPCVSNVDDVKAALDQARTVQHIALDEAENRRTAGADEKRRNEGRLTRAEAVEWLMAEAHSSRAFAYANVKMAEGGTTPYGMTYADGYWQVPASTPESGD